jgi:hypothetical protein
MEVEKMEFRRDLSIRCRWWRYFLFVIRGTLGSDGASILGRVLLKGDGEIIGGSGGFHHEWDLGAPLIWFEGREKLLGFFRAASVPHIRPYTEAIDFFYATRRRRRDLGIFWWYYTTWKCVLLQYWWVEPLPATVPARGYTYSRMTSCKGLVLLGMLFYIVLKRKFLVAFFFQNVRDFKLPYIRPDKKLVS